VHRNRLGAQEDPFLATAFLGGGLLFVVSLFTAAALAAGLLEALADGHIVLPGSEAYSFGRRTVSMLLNAFAFKIAAAFIFSTGTIGLCTAFLPRGVALVGSACGLVLLLVLTSWAWIGLLFPFWVLLVSTVVLTAEFRRRREGPPIDSPVRAVGQDGGACDEPVEMTRRHTARHRVDGGRREHTTREARRWAGRAADRASGATDQPGSELPG
jgi:hypothetical protein